MGGVCFDGLLVGPRGQVRVCIFKTLGQAHEATGILKIKQCEKGSSGLKQIETDLSDNVKLSA